MSKDNKQVNPLGKATSVVGSAANAAASKAVEMGAAGAEAVGDLAKNVADAAEGAKKAIDDKSRERLMEEVAEYAPKVESALKTLEDTMAFSILETLGDSPMPITKSLSHQIKATFPIPREQTVVWADAEFDLRPSGIVATNKGVFVKSDAKAFAIGKGGETDPTQSRLSFFLWESFEPAWFAGEDEDNLALQVDPACATRFVEACRQIAKAGERLRAAAIDSVFRSLDDIREEEAQAAAVGGAEMLSAEKAVFAEQKAVINNPAGHGEMVEDAITMLDRAQRLDAKVVGRDNAKNGADRIVDGMLVQTKYYKSARGSLEACFDPSTGLYRYMTESGEPMQLEVPKDQYDKVLKLFKWKIEQGKVPGVTDPEQAEQIVRKGRLTYQQAVNLAKPGTIESLAFDAATGAVVCMCAFGISFLATTFMAYRHSKNMDEAIQAGIAAGIQVFGIAFVQHMVVSQLSRTGLAGMLMTPSQYIVGKLGYRASALIVNGIRALAGKQAIHGAAASKQLAKILRSNAVTAAATMVVFSIPETYKIVTRKASAAQYVKNLAALAASVAGGMGGATAAGIAAAKVAGAVGTTVAPGVGTAIGVAGGFVGGVASAAVVNVAGNVLHEGDGATFGRLFNAIVSSMAVEYMLDEDEIDQLVEVLDETKQSALKQLMEDTFSSDQQEDTVRCFLTPVYDEIVARREKFILPTDDQITHALIELSQEEAETTPQRGSQLG